MDLVESGRPLFLGSHKHALDAKGRVAVPSRFRVFLADGLVVTRGFDGCIAVYPRAAWESLSSRIHALSITDFDVRQFRRMVFSEAIDLQLDSQGRILVPSALRSFAGIDREVVVIGVESSVEIWSPERWAATSQEIDLASYDIAALLAGML